MKTTCQLLLVVLLLGTRLPHVKAQSQGSAEVYAAPGMRVSLPMRRPPDASQPKAALSPPALPRYWHQPEAQKRQGAGPCRALISQQVRYPEAALRAGVAGTFAALLTVTAAGSVGAVTVTRRDVPTAAPANPTADDRALAAELTRVVSQLRFEPAASASDTVTVTHRFGSQ